MKYRNIPQSTLSPSVIGLGTASFGSDVGAMDAFHLLDTYFAHGGNFIDTAHAYGAWMPGGQGLSETIIGQWMKERGIRDHIILATKGAHPHFSARHIPRLSRQAILADLEASLRCLQIETIDLYWLHRDDPSRPVADILETLNSQVALGKIRAFGCSNWNVARIEEALHYTLAHEMAGFVGNQCMWSFALPNPHAIEDKTLVIMDSQTLAFHQKTGMAIVAYSAQARGFFSRISHNPESLPERVRRIYASEENTQRFSRLQHISHEFSLPLSVVALAYLTSQALPTFPLASYTRVEHLLESIAAGDVQLSPEILHYLETGD